MYNRITNHIFKKVFLSSSLTTFSLIGASFIDSLIISRCLGTDAAAATGLVYPFYFFAGALYGCIATGFKSLAAKKLTRGDIEGLNEAYSECVFLSLAVSAAVMMILFYFAGPVVFAFGARGGSASLYEAAKSYLIGLTAGLPALMLNSLTSIALQYDNGEREIRYAYLIGMAADVILDIAAVKLKAGLLGMGLTSTVSAYISFGILCLHFRGGRSELQFRRVHFSKEDLKGIFYMGSERAVYRMLSFARSLIINPFVVSVGGTAAVAALSIRNSFMNFIAIPGYGIADGVSVGADLAYNMRSRGDLLGIGTLAHRHAVKFSLIPGILIILFSGPVSKFYWQGGTEEGRKLLAFALVMGGIKLLFETLLTARVSYLQAVRKIKDAKILLLAYNFASVTACVVLAGLICGPYGIMAAFTLSDMLVMAGIFILYCIRRKKMRVSADDYLLVSGECDTAPGDVIELELRDTSDCALAAEKVQLFCHGHKMDPKQGLCAGLCTEEASAIALSISRKVTDGGCVSGADVRLYAAVADGHIRIHIRFYCRGVSLLEEIGKMSNERGSLFFDDLSERIIGGFAAEIREFNSMDVENWIIIV